MKNVSVLIVGAGIAGPTLAYWLQKAAFRPTLIERAPAPRSGGYVIDFWGLGYDIADQMGLRGDLDRLGYHMREMRIVADDGTRLTGFGVQVFRELTGGRFVTISRCDLAHLLYEKASSVAETIFGDEIVHLEQDPDGVNVTFGQTGTQRFDLVIGADGLHSAVRRLTFGPQHQFEKSLGYTVGAFESSGYRPRDEGVYIIHNKPGSMLARFALREDKTLFLFVLVNDGQEVPSIHDIAAQKAFLRHRFRETGWESGLILERLQDTRELYFDRVSQIQMPTWTRGRIALIGDAAFCVSLMAGQGSALAMTAAYVLAGELAGTRGSHEDAFRRYEDLMRPYIETKQRGARAFGRAFAPKTEVGLSARNLTIAAMAIPGLSRLAFGRDIIDRLKLPEYNWG